MARSNAFAEGDPQLLPGSRHLPEIRKVGLGGQDAARQQMKSLLEEEKPDIVHLHSTQSLGVLQACTDYGAMLMTAHDYRFVCHANTFFYKRTKEECH